MIKYVYLFGAGASAGVLPTIAGLREKFNDYRDEILSLRDEYQEHDFDRQQFQLMLNVFDRIKNEWTHHTIDTYANSLLSQPEELKTFKGAFSAFFYWLECQCGVDWRYQELLKNILLKPDRFGFRQCRKDVCLITWNYDLQLIKAYSSLVREKNLLKIHDKLLLGPRAKISAQQDIRPMHFYQLNGSCTPYDPQADFVLGLNSSFETLGKREAFIKSLEVYQEILGSKNIESQVGYGWEDQDDLGGVYSTAKLNRDAVFNLETNGTTLIVCGYSFPGDNSPIDAQIIKRLKVREIIIYDVEGRKIREKVRSLSPFLADDKISIRTWSKTTEFPYPEGFF